MWKEGELAGVFAECQLLPPDLGGGGQLGGQDGEGPTFSWISWVDCASQKATVARSFRMGISTVQSLPSSSATRGRGCRGPFMIWGRIPGRREGTGCVCQVAGAPPAVVGAPREVPPSWEDSGTSPGDREGTSVQLVLTEELRCPHRGPHVANPTTMWNWVKSTPAAATRDSPADPKPPRPRDLRDIQGSSPRLLRYSRLHLAPLPF